MLLTFLIYFKHIGSIVELQCVIFVFIDICFLLMSSMSFSELIFRWGIILIISESLYVSLCCSEIGLIS